MKGIDIFQKQKVISSHDVVVMDRGNNIFRVTGRADNIRQFIEDVCDHCEGMLLEEPVKVRKRSGHNPFGFLGCKAGGSNCLQLCQYLDELTPNVDGGEK